MWLIGLLATVVGLAFALAPPARAADPVPFAALQGTCGTTHGDVAAEPVALPHPSVIARMTVTGGTVDLNDNVLTAGDVIWDVRPALGAGATPTVSPSCFEPAGDASFTTTFYDRPAAPTSFSGVGNASGSVLGFVAPGTAQYVADVRLTGASMSLWPLEGGEPHAVTASGRVALGTLSAGQHALLLVADDDSQPSWTVTIRALPVGVSALVFERPAARPGSTLRASYATDGDTTVSAVVIDRAGRVVAAPVSDVRVGAGPHSLVWETKAGGRPLREGTYTLRLTAHDPSGETTIASTRVTLDRRPPAIRVTSPYDLRADRAVSGTIADALSGVVAATITDASGPDPIDLAGDPSTFSYRPPAGWTPGPHRLIVTATDAAGNTRTSEVRFNVRPEMPAGGRRPASSWDAQTPPALPRPAS